MLYKLYIDDTLVLAKPCDVQHILNNFNTFDSQIQFTVWQAKPDKSVSSFNSLFKRYKTTVEFEWMGQNNKQMVETNTLIFQLQKPVVEKGKRWLRKELTSKKHIVGREK